MYLPIPHGALFRPAYLPRDVDPRIDQSSIWMGLVRGSRECCTLIDLTARDGSVLRTSCLSGMQRSEDQYPLFTVSPDMCPMPGEESTVYAWQIVGSA